MWRLARASDTLDVNSLYAYLVVAALFGQTSRVATTDDAELVGFMAGLTAAGSPDRLFVWQVAVAPTMQKRGVASALIEDVLRDPALRRIRYLTATVTASNHASAELFRSIARRRRTTFDRRPFFPAALFGDTGHAAEDVIEIGPLRESAVREA